MKKFIKKIKVKYQEWTWELHILCTEGINEWEKYRKHKKQGFPNRYYSTIHPDWEIYWEQQKEEIEAVKV